MQNAAIKLAPSILAADFARLGEQVEEAEKAGADRIHVDIMDGHFVPNLSMGAPVVQSLRRVTRLPLETHLMISDPAFFLEEFVEAGSDSVLVHWEGNNNLNRTVRRIKELGKRAGVVINPATPPGVLEEILPEVEQVLVMTVNPGFGHQHFLESVLPKIRRVCRMIHDLNPGCELEVDGGVDMNTGPLAAAAGANVFRRRVVGFWKQQGSYRCYGGPARFDCRPCEGVNWSGGSEALRDFEPRTKAKMATMRDDSIKLVERRVRYTELEAWLRR
jgi:ribulose-phosphate 3-epimerase